MLSACIEKSTGQPVKLIITDNSYSVLSAKSRGNILEVRLHSMFLSAGHDVLRETSDYITGKKKHTPLLREFINSNTHQLKKKTPRKITLRTQGKYCNLLEIYRALNSEYFEDRVSAVVTWGLKGPRRAARKRTLGSYNKQNKTIRINPVLDSSNVPKYFIEYVVYHEMLHADIDSRPYNGRRPVHCREFRRREKLFSNYKKALMYEKKRW